MRELSQNTASRSFKITSTSAVAQGFWIISFTILTAAGARIEILHQPVPFTLQTFMVVLAGGFLGMRNGFISQVIYLMMGCAGFPVFAGGHAGLSVLLGPTGGYLLAFPLASSIIGWMVHLRKGFWWNFFSCSIGFAAIFTLGAMQLNTVYFHNISDSIKAGFLIFSLWDVSKLFAAASIITVYSRHFVGP